MIPRPRLSKSLMTAAVVVLVAMLAGACSENAPQVTVTRPATAVPNSRSTDARRLSEGASKLIEAMNTPVSSFHFSFKGQENINAGGVQDKSGKPMIGPVGLEVDVTPLQLDLKEMRGGTLKPSQAKRADEMNWKMAHLAVLGALTSPNLAIAVASNAAGPPANDLVGTIMADKYTFDTTTAAGEQKRALDLARLVLPSIKDCKGTAWVAKDSGELVKFNVDAAYLDRNGHAWNEHYQGVVVPK